MYSSLRLCKYRLPSYLETYTVNESGISERSLSEYSSGTVRAINSVPYIMICMCYGYLLPSALFYKFVRASGSGSGFGVAPPKRQHPLRQPRRGRRGVVPRPGDGTGQLDTSKQTMPALALPFLISLSTSNRKELPLVWSFLALFSRRLQYRRFEGQLRKFAYPVHYRESNPTVVPRGLFPKWLCCWKMDDIRRGHFPLTAYFPTCSFVGFGDRVRITY